MLMSPSNTLLLDEPTTHLDIDSTNVLLEALTDFGGTVVFVSHDRYFVDRLATKIIEVGQGNAIFYPGTYTEFRLRQLENEVLHLKVSAKGLDRKAALQQKSYHRKYQTNQPPALTSVDARRKAQVEVRKRKKGICRTRVTTC